MSVQRITSEHMSVQRTTSDTSRAQQYRISHHITNRSGEEGRRAEEVTSTRERQLTSEADSNTEETEPC